MLFLRGTGGWPGAGWRNPFEELERMRRQMDWLSTSLSRDQSREVAAGVFPTMNVTEDRDNYYVRAELPGLKAEELDISVTGDTLAISGGRKLPLRTRRPSIIAGNGMRVASAVSSACPLRQMWTR